MLNIPLYIITVVDYNYYFVVGYIFINNIFYFKIRFFLAKGFASLKACIVEYTHS